VHPRSDSSVTRLFIIVIIIIYGSVFKYIVEHNSRKSVITTLNDRSIISSMNGDFSVRRHVRGLCGSSSRLYSVCLRIEQLDREPSHAL
jgi:uncharacterized membrane protein